MKQLREYIANRGHDFAERPLFAYLRDTTVDARRRLAFAPFLAHFVMSFADLYRFFLVQNEPRDRYQELINVHLSEDSGHWKWFLADLATMGLDPTLTFSGALRFLWSDATIKTRSLTYEICRLSAGMSSLQTLALVNCVEVAGRVALGAAAVAGHDLETQLGRKLVYFGSHHIDTEANHALEQPTVHRLIDEVILDDVERAKVRAIVGQSFEHFRGFVDEVFQTTQSERAFEHQLPA
jgi:hypothetical protein